MNEQEITRAKILGVLIRDARLHDGRTVADCARTLGVSAETFAKAEQGEYVFSLPEIEVLALYLDVPMAHFWGSQTLGTLVAPDYAALLRLRHRIVGTLLRLAREEQGRNLAELAEDTGVSEERIRQYEQGQAAVPLFDLERLGKALDLSLDHFAEHQRGPVGRHEQSQKLRLRINELPVELQEFVAEPVNVEYLKTAHRLSAMDVQQLRRIAESILDITL